MSWTCLLISALGAWAMLLLIAGDRGRRVAQLEARRRAETEAAADRAREIPSVG